MFSSVLYAALAVFTLVPTSRAATHATPITLTLPSNIPSSSNVVQDNFAGISIEFNVADIIIGRDANSIYKPFENYLTNLRSRISSPLRLRVGGNSLDGSFYNPNATQMFTFNVIKSKTIANQPVTYGPQVLTTLKQLSQDVGGTLNNLGLSFAHPYNDSDIVRFALDAQHELGDGLDTLMLGNEPDLYLWNGHRWLNYTVADYFVEWSKVVGDLKGAGLGPVLASPTTCCDTANWMLEDVLNLTLPSAGNEMVKYASVQHYPQVACTQAGTDSWDISYFTNHAKVQSLAKWQANGVARTRAAGQPMLLTEFNSASCGGVPGRSDTFAAALWTIDYELGLAANNFAAAHLHTREAGVTYNIFTPPNDTATASSSGWVTGPQYYSLLLLAEAFSTKNATGSTGSVVVDLNLDNPTAAAGYALYNANSLTSAPRALVLFNFNNDATNATFAIPKGLPIDKDLQASVRYLTAPSLNEGKSSAISYAGQTLDEAGTGTLSGALVQTEIKCTSGCEIEVPGPGVALVILEAQTQEQLKQTKSDGGAAARIGSGGILLSLFAGAVVSVVLALGRGI